MEQSDRRNGLNMYIKYRVQFAVHSRAKVVDIFWIEHLLCQGASEPIVLLYKLSNNLKILCTDKRFLNIENRYCELRCRVSDQSISKNSPKSIRVPTLECCNIQILLQSSPYGYRRAVERLEVLASS